MPEALIFDYGLAAGAVGAMFYLARHCAEKTRDTIEKNTQVISNLAAWLKGDKGAK